MPEANDDTDDTFLICLPTKNVPKPPVPGGVKRVCVRCQRQVWVAPSGLRLQRERGAMLLCIPCYLADKVALGESLHDFTPAQMKELVEGGVFTDAHLPR